MQRASSQYAAQSFPVSFLEKENKMIRNLRSIGAWVVCLLALPIAVADWMPGDPHKMHYPQMPDPLGIDVRASLPKILADDWQCSETGPVSDVHLWGSWYNDQKFPGTWFHLSIHANLPADPSIPYSRPGDLLWQQDFSPNMYQQREWGTGPQTWWDPKETYSDAINHFVTWQYNFENILNAFTQTEGEIYWLDVTAFAGFTAAGEPIPLPQPFMFGWKNSISPLFMDDAVWMHTDDANPIWRPLFDPRVPPGVPPRSMDLAFVITPEPAALILMAFGGFLIRRLR